MANITVKLVIGLGNDDKKYAKTYHNVGFLMVDFLKQIMPQLTLQKITGYMNEAGSSVKEIIRQHNATPEATLIIHDDSDIQLGEYKFSFARGAAGHKGVQNIMDVLKTKNFWRLRIGIRPKQKTGAVRKKSEEFVLKNITPTNLKVLNEVFTLAAPSLQNQ